MGILLINLEKFCCENMERESSFYQGMKIVYIEKYVKIEQGLKLTFKIFHINPLNCSIPTIFDQ